MANLHADTPELDTLIYYANRNFMVADKAAAIVGHRLKTRTIPMTEVAKEIDRILDRPTPANLNEVLSLYRSDQRQLRGTDNAR